jgi:hypothetical protein
MNYIDIASEFRDRNLYPNPCDFEVIINPNENSINEIAKSTMYYPTPNISAVYAYPRNVNNNTLFIEPVNYLTISGLINSDSISQTENYFNNKLLEMINDDPQVNGGLLTTTYYTINNSLYNTSETILESGTTSATSIIPTSVSENKYSCFLPLTSSDIDNFYVGKHIIFTDVTSSPYFYGPYLITLYDGGRRIITFSSSDSLLFGTLVNKSYQIISNENWSIVTNDNIATVGTLEYPSHQIYNYPTYTRNLYRIREDIPFFSGNVNSLNTLYNISLSPNASSNDDYYNNMWIWFTNPKQYIDTGTFNSVTASNYYDFSQTDILELSNPITEDYTGYVIVMQESISGNGYLQTAVILETNIVLSQVTIQCGFSVNYKANGNEIYWIKKQNPNFNQYHKIKDYDGLSKTVTLYQPLGNVPLENDTFDILEYNKDSWNSLTVVQPPIVDNRCYLMTIQSLTLPNQILDNGGLISSYPYIYVEFSNVNHSFTTVNYTNVPNLNYILFKIPITNVNDPETAPFVILDGRNMYQTAYINMKQPFRIRITLPNGDIFTTIEKDTQPPLPAVFLLQMSITIGMKSIK